MKIEVGKKYRNGEGDCVHICAREGTPPIFTGLVVDPGARRGTIMYFFDREGKEIPLVLSAVNDKNKLNLVREKI